MNSENIIQCIKKEGKGLRNNIYSMVPVFRGPECPLT